MHRRLIVGHKLRADTPLLKKRRGPSYVYKTITLRLQPVRRDDRIVFMDRSMIFDEVGHIYLTAFHENRGLYLDYFEVGEPFRGKGYGREMYEWIEEYAWRMGMRRIILAPRDSAVGFWRKMGFRLFYRQTCEMIKVLR